MLKRKQVQGDACANAAAHMLIQVVAKSKWQDVNQLLAKVKTVGTRLVKAAPKELVIGNIVRRVLGLIRDEASEDRNADDESSEACSEPQTPVASGGAAKTNLTAEPSSSPAPPRRPGPAPLRQNTLPNAASFVSSKSMYNIFLGTDAAAIQTTGAGTPGTGASTPVFAAQATSVQALRSEVLDGINEILDEMGQADDQIAGFSEVHIHPGDRVLVFQPSPTVERFLLRAAAKKRFSVFIADMRPPQWIADSATTTTVTPYASLRKKLKALGIEYVVLQGMTFSPCMPLMNTVVLDAKAVVSDGGALVQAGAAAVARAARHLAKTVILLAGVYKLSPENPIDPDAWTELGDPSDLVDYADGAMLDVDVVNVVTEFMPPDLIDVYVTNLGTHAQNQLMTVMADHYKPEDVDFHFD